MRLVQADMRLVQDLVQLGALTKDQQEAVQKYVLEHKVPFSAAILELEFLTSEQLLRALQELAEIAHDESSTVSYVDHVIKVVEQTHTLMERVCRKGYPDEM